jgi:hypothetical protein
MDELKADIAAHGIQVPILVNKAKDTILDGRNRILAATELNLSDDEVPIEIFNGDEADIPGAILSRNIRRRHLSKIEQVKLISAVLKAAMGDAGVSRHHGEKLAEGRPKDAHKAAVVAEAKKHAISRRTVERGLGPPRSGRFPRPSKRKKEKSLHDRVFAKFTRFMDSFPVTEHREVRKLLHEFTGPKDPYDPTKKVKPAKPGVVIYKSPHAQK